MNLKGLRPLVVAAALALTGSSGTPALADNTAATYHRIALITDFGTAGTPPRSFDISFVERPGQTYFLAARTIKGVDIFDASSITFVTLPRGFVSHSQLCNSISAP